ncbi:MAG: ArnT family glycosyltransferase [Patescibacteria group bacterium]|jgi:4-amino-4-deoxy-L-arabinose transferase-like glycosyltransferase
MINPAKKIYFGLFIFSLAFFATRLINLTRLPVFCDEAIYLRWSQIIASSDAFRFVPLSDGKQPLFMWLVVPFFKIISDPLYAGRFLSVISGFFSMFTLILIFSLLSNYKSKNPDPIPFIFESLKKSFPFNLLPALFYLTLPFSFFFDRMSLPDNLLACLSSISFFLSLLLAKYLRFDISILLGISLGLSWLTKSPAIYFIVLSLLTVFLLTIPKLNLKTISYPVFSSLLAFFIYNILRLGPQFHLIAQRNKDYIRPLSEILKNPTNPLFSHTLSTLNLFKTYVSTPLLILLAFALLLSVLQKKFNRQYFVCFLWFFLPLLSNNIFAQVFTARYILYTIPPLILLISLAFNYVFQSSYRNVSTLLVILSLILNLSFNYRLSSDPKNTTLPKSEQGYLSDWTSGWGIKETYSLLNDNQKNHQIVVGTEGYFGTLPDGLQIYTASNANLKVFGVGLMFTDIPESLLETKQNGNETYLLINKSRNNLNPQSLNKLELVKSFPKPGNDSLDLYKIL